VAFALLFPNVAPRFSAARDERDPVLGFPTKASGRNPSASLRAGRRESPALHEEKPSNWDHDFVRFAQFLCNFRRSDECRLERAPMKQSKDLSAILIGRVSIRNAAVFESRLVASGDEIPEVEEIKEVEEADQERRLLSTAASPNFKSCRINPDLA
jgi:hypothetical protein